MADGTRVYVHNLPWSITSELLQEHMSVAGAVESVSLMSYANGRSKGCAIVKYATPEEAQHAITALNDVEVDGRRLLVREDREGPEGPVPGSKPASAIVRGRGGIARGAGRGGRGGRGGLGGGAGGDAPRSRAAPSENAVYVGNLPWSVTWQNLKDMFTPYGATYSDIKMDKSSRSKGWGIVKFSTLEEAHAAIAGMNGSDCEGRPMEVRLDRGAVTREEVEGGAY